MKKRYAFVGMLTLSMFASLQSKAQNYQPFGSESRKVFATLDHSTTYSLAFDSAVVAGDSTVYYNFFDVQDTMVETSCVWWGGPYCTLQDKPTWAGPRVASHTDGSHTFRNVSGEALNFTFHTNAQDTTLLYADNTQRFRLVYDNTASVVVLGQPDNVRQWRILHTDLSGTPINSPLNNTPITVGESIGLIRFFRVDSFPQVLEPLELVGQAEPALGIHVITPATLEDHQPGDVIQFNESSQYYLGPPWLNFDRYRKWTYLSRTEGMDAVYYSVRQELYDPADNTLAIDTIDQSFDRSTIIASIPFERFDGTHPVLAEVDYCGLPLWTYVHTLNQGAGYCAEENCWGPVDTGGPPPYGDNTYVPGLGIYHASAAVVSPNGWSTSGQVVYFNKNGQECGQEIVMGLPAISAAPSLTLSPNPTDGLLSISTTRAMKAITLRDASGRMVLQATLQGQIGKLDLGSLPQGLYLAEVLFSSGARATSRVLVSAR